MTRVDSASSQTAPGYRARRFRGWRWWLLRISVLLFSPAFFLGLMELGLRWSGCRYPTEFFVGPDANGAFRSNDQFGWRFFPRPLARRPQPALLSAKPAGTVRIFVLGESAAMGIPDPSFSFGRILEVMLRQRYPEARFEVVNAAMTAINSHVILDIAKDCASQGADIFVVYMGNNEVTGPYGPGTVFGQWSRRLAMVRAAIWLKSTGVGQWLSDAADWFRGIQGTPAVWQGMAMCLENPIAADDSRLGLVYDSFRRNLADLCDVAGRAGAEVILSTVAVNLDDFPPLASLHRSGLLPEERTRWESIYQAAVASESTGDLPNAIQQYQESARIDDRFADLQFRLGRCLAAAGRHSEAAEHYRLARDLDALRFRADSRVNQILREYAAGRGTDGVRLADGERAIDEIARDRRAPFSGKLFRDHVHLTFDGNYLLAEAILAQLEQALPEEIRHRANGNLPTRAECAVWLALTPYDELQMSAWAANTMSRPPFTQQLDHDDRQADAREQVENLRRAASAEETFEEAMKTYATALARSPNDWQIHDHLAAILLRRGKVAEAVEHWREAVRLLPTNIDTLHQLATVLATSPIASVRNGPEAVGLAERAVMLAGGGEPMFLDTLAAAHAEAGNLAKAIETARQAIALASRQQKQSLIATLQAKIADYERRARRASQPQR